MSNTFKETMPVMKKFIDAVSAVMNQALFSQTFSHIKFLALELRGLIETCARGGCLSSTELKASEAHVNKHREKKAHLHLASYPDTPDEQKKKAILEEVAEFTSTLCLAGLLTLKTS